MSRLAQRIRETQLEAGSIAIFWLAQAGFVYKTPTEKTVYVDPYLTDCVERLIPRDDYGFKRMIPTPIEPEEVEADFVMSTHAHPDHLDVDAIPVLLRNPRTTFVGAPDCRKTYQQLGVPESRYRILRCGESLVNNDLRITAVYADHGDLAPDALGFLLTIGDIRVWQVGDSAYRPERWDEVFNQGVDVVILPINGAYGNLDASEAAKLAGNCGAKIAIPCHFWMFPAHDGNPAQFIGGCTLYAPQVKPVLLSPGEPFIYRNQ